MPMAGVIYVACKSVEFLLGLRRYTGMERRKHKRFDLEYTLQVISETGDMVMTALTSNLSDGGLRVPMPSEALPDCGQQVQINLTIRHNDTGEVEMYSGMGTVLRHLGSDDDGMSEVAVKFHAPMDLRLAESSEPVPNDLV